MYIGELAQGCADLGLDLWVVDEGADGWVVGEQLPQGDSLLFEVVELWRRFGEGRQDGDQKKKRSVWHAGGRFLSMSKI